MRYELIYSFIAQAFGVGAFEDDDADIYAVEDMSNYNITMDTSAPTDSNFGWTAPKDHGKQSVPVDYVGTLLDGFCLGSKKLRPQKVANLFCFSTLLFWVLFCWFVSL